MASARDKVTPSGGPPRPPALPVVRPARPPQVVEVQSGPPPGNARKAPRAERIPPGSGMAKLRAKVARDSPRSRSR